MSTTVFLITDIEGSTALWAQHPEAMKVGLRHHDELVGGAVQEAGGLLFKHTGDGFCATFASPAEAALAAHDMQVRLRAADWGELGELRVRAGIHVGEAEGRQGDWFGPALNRCSRLTAIGHGGQILVSGAGEALLADTLPPGLGLRDLGLHRLRDLSHPEHVWQLTGPGLLAEFPPLRSLDYFRGRLPPQLSLFVGRDREQRAIVDLLGSHRLVTLVGAGGMGKTRLSLQVAAEAVDRFPDGAWFMELAPLMHEGGIEDAIVATLGFQPQPGLSPRQLLAQGLESWRALLLLDNCEHLVAGVGDLIDELLNRCPSLSVLATSRTPLRLTGERVWQVGPLALADEAPALFADRASSARSDFVVDDVHRPVVDTICRQLDGMPLAIELAAARLRSMTADELLERLGSRFRLLRSDRERRIGRHATLEAVVDWSYGLLTTAERQLLTELAVFAGGFELGAAHAIRDTTGSDELDTLDALDALVDKSLVQATEIHGRTRYSMLETIRQYAVARWSDEDRTRLARWHATWCLELAEAGDEQLKGADQVRWIKRLEAEHDNLRAAMRWALGPDGDLELSLRLSGALAWFWRVRSHLSEGRRWLADALASSRCPDPEDARYDRIRIKALNGLGLLAYAQSELPVAKETLVSALELARSIGDPAGAGWSLHALGRVAIEEHDLADASDLLEEAIRTSLRAGDHRAAAYSQFFLAGSRCQQGDAETAEQLLKQAEEPLRAMGDLWGLGTLTMVYAGPALDRGDLAEAARRYGEGLGLLAELGSVWMARQALLGLAGVAGLAEQWEVLARLHGAAGVLGDSLGLPTAAQQRSGGRLLTMLGVHEAAGPDAARHALGDARFEALWNEGRSYDLKRAIEEGLAAVAELASGGGPALPRSNAQADHEAELTSREWDVVRLLAEGRSNREIADALSLSVRTVENHLAHLYAKLGVRSRVEAALYVVRARPVTPDGSA